MEEFEKAKWPGWETVRLIGRGSYGAVYEIQRDMFGDVEKAALKVITIPQNTSDIEEMYSEGYDEESITSAFQSYLKGIIREYSLMRKLNDCPGIVSCDDVRYIQHDDGIGWDIFIKMELLTPLLESLPKEVPEETVIKIAKDLCAALEMCGKYNIIHRDIKPQNIFLSPNGFYKLGDFGVAKTVEKTMGGTKIGTYKYMAPEVYHNQPYGAATDIYSLGLVLYWLLNKRRMPFSPLPPEKLTASLDEQARARRLSGEAIPEPAHGSQPLKQIVLKACAYDPKDRYSSAAEMRKALNEMGMERVTQVALAAEPEKAVAAPQEAAPEEDATVGLYSQVNIPATPAAEAAPEEDATIGLYSQVNIPATPAAEAAPEEDATVGLYSQVNIPVPPAAEAAPEEDATVGLYSQVNIPATPAAEAALEEDATVGLYSQVNIPATPAAEAAPEEDATVGLFHKTAPQDKSRAAAEEDTRRKEAQPEQKPVKPEIQKPRTKEDAAWAILLGEKETKQAPTPQPAKQETKKDAAWAILLGAKETKQVPVSQPAKQERKEPAVPNTELSRLYREQDELESLHHQWEMQAYLQKKNAASSKKKS